MSLNVVSYATEKFFKSQKFLEQTSYNFGADKVFSFTKLDLDSEFVKNNYSLLSNRRGAGYWCWKPYVILKAFELINYGDTLLYLDSGMSVINDLKFLPIKQEITSFEMYDKHQYEWTKYDTFHIMKCLNNKYLISKQRQAGMQIYLKTQNSINFVEEYLKYCLDAQCINDNKSMFGTDLPTFKEHRHDQSIFTNLCVKYNIPVHRDPTQWGNIHKIYYDDLYPQILNHHRGII